MVAPRSVARDVEDVEVITNGLTRTILGDNAASTNLAVATPARTDIIDAITHRLGQAILGKDENASQHFRPEDKKQPKKRIKERNSPQPRIK